MATLCDDLAHVDGTTLTFETLRVGFPSAEIYVVDNASLHAARVRIKQLAKATGCRFTQLDVRVSHDAFLNQAIRTCRSESAAVFIDPDMVFWKCIDGWNFNCLAAGRLIPRYWEEAIGGILEPRLHPSLMWIPNVAHFRAVVSQLQARKANFNPFETGRVKRGQHTYIYDTGATLYAAVKEELTALTEEQLDCFDHLIHGTHLAHAKEVISPVAYEMLKKVHQAAAERNYSVLKGLWRLQEQYFQERRVVQL